MKKLSKSVLGKLRLASIFLLSFVITFQLSIGTALAEREHLARARFTPINLFGPSGRGAMATLESQIASLEAALEQAGSVEEAARLAPLPKDLFKLIGQKHRIYRVDGSGADRRFVVDREIPLDQLITDNPEVHMINPSRELRIAYNPATKELEIQRWAMIDGSETLTDGHVIPGVEITTRAGNHVLQDSNVIMFATSEGIRAILGIDLANLVFKASLPASLLVEAPVGHSIEKIEFLNPGSEPRPVANATEIFDGDLGVTLASDGERLHVISRRELLVRLGLWKTVQLKMLQLANPDLQAAGAVQEALAQNIDEIRAFLGARDALLESSESSDLQNAALANMARNTDFAAQAALIARGDSGTAFERLASAPRHVFGAEGEWIHNFAQIEARRRADAAAGTPVKTWKEYLIDSIRNPEPEVAATIAEAAEQQPTIVKGRVARLVDTVKRVATPRRVLVMAGFLATDIGNLSTDGAVTRTAFSVLTHIFSWTMQVPGLGKLIEQFESLPGYLQEPWALSRLAVATAAVLSFRPLSMIAAQRYARMRGYDWSQKKAFFTYGLRLYSRVVYPVQKIFWERIARQNQLYAALKNGLSPLNPAAWTNPFRRGNTAGASRLDAAIREESTRKSRAMILAAAIVAEKSRQEGFQIDPATLMLLMNAPQGEAAQTLAQSLGSEVGENQWMDVTNRVIGGLKKLADGGAGAVDQQSAEQYHAVFSRIANELKSEDRLAQGSRADRTKVALSRFIRSRFMEFKRMTSKNIVPFLFFGLPQLRIYDTYRNAEIDDDTAEIAEHQYREDYDFSTLFYAGSDAATFGAMPTGDVAANAEITANQLEQVFIYGVQLGYDVLTTGTLNPLDNPYAPVTDELNAELRVRQQTFMEAAREMIVSASNPDSPSMLATHKQYMINTLTGFQVRMAAGTLTRAAGLAAIGIASGAIGLDTLMRVVSAIPLQATALLAKIGVTTSGPGYAVVWPYVSHNMRVIKNRVAANEQALKMAQYLLDSGIRTVNAERIRTGVATMIGLYQAYGTALPQRFTAVDAGTYGIELARELYEYSLQPQNVPAPTRISESMATTLNVGVGALVSTILYVSLSKVLFNPEAAPIELFVAAVESFAVTFVGLTLAQPVVRNVLRVAAPIFRPVVERCKNWLKPQSNQ